jgi:hypothetical protein
MFMIRNHASALVVTLMLVLTIGLSCSDNDSPVDPGDLPIRVPGDFETIGEAILAAAPGRTIELTAASYSFDKALVIEAKTDLVIRGAQESGVRPVLQFATGASTDAISITADCMNVTIEGIEIEPAPGMTYRHGITIRGAGTEVRDCWIEDARSNSVNMPSAVPAVLIERNYLIRSGLFGVSCNAGADAIVLRNTIVDTGDCGLYSFDSAPMIMRNIVVRSANWGIAVFGTTLPSITCNALFQNITADYSPLTPVATDDILADPVFCSETTFSLMHTSPCTQENSVTCGVIGASDDVCEGS